MIQSDAIYGRVRMSYGGGLKGSWGSDVVMRVAIWVVIELRIRSGVTVCWRIFGISNGLPCCNSLFCWIRGILYSSDHFEQPWRCALFQVFSDDMCKYPPFLHFNSWQFPVTIFQLWKMISKLANVSWSQRHPSDYSFCSTFPSYPSHKENLARR